MPGQPDAETWKGTSAEHPGAATWFTGTYDPQLGLIYWSAGNPGPDHNGDEREGDNLYSDSVVALEAKTGKLRWHYQFTPHDVWDWDAQEPLVLVDAAWQGRPRKLLLQANRNGFFYVIDRASGELLLGKPFVDKVTWAREIGRDGRPMLNPNQIPNAEGVRVCPSLLGAANWWSNAFHPGTGLFYVQSTEACSIFAQAGRPLASREDLHRRRHARLCRRPAAQVSAGVRLPDRRAGMETAGNRAGHHSRRHSGDRRRPGVLLRGQQRFHSGGCLDRRAALEIPGEPLVARVTHDLRV